jgi:hypothetical protein
MSAKTCFDLHRSTWSRAAWALALAESDANSAEVALSAAVMEAAST